MADSQDKEAQDSAKEPALTPKEPKPTAPKPAPGQDPAQDTDTDWKTEARKWEDRAKANRNEVRELRSRLEELWCLTDRLLEWRSETEKRSSAPGKAVEDML